MRIDHLFYLYMLAVGGAAATLLVVEPTSADFFIKPYFWVLLAVAAFDLVTYLLRGGDREKMVGMDARLLGFVLGIATMVVVKMLMGSNASVF